MNRFVFAALGSACFALLLPVRSNAEQDRAPQGPGPHAHSPRPDLPDVVTLDRALALLRERSPRQRALAARVAVAATERVAASAYPNPSLSYGGLALAHGAQVAPQWQHQIVVEQPVLLSGQRDARRSVADLGVNTARAEAATELAERAHAVRAAFFKLLTNQERVRVLEENLADLSRIEEIVRGRQQAGESSVYDVTRIELETGALRLEIASARTDVADAAGQLATELGFPGWQPRARGELTPNELPPSLEQLWAKAQRRPAVAAARAREASARGGLDLARRERQPVPSLALGTLLTQQEGSASVYLGLSVPLPVFDYGRGALARAGAEVTAEARALEATLAESRAELERAQLVLLQRRETLRQVEEHLVGKLPTLRALAEQSYLGGGSGILDLLDALRSLREIRLVHLERLESVKVAETDLITAAALE